MWLTNKKRYRITNLTSVSHVSGPRHSCAKLPKIM